MVPEAVVGAGTARSAADVQACAMAGARFIVSPVTPRRWNGLPERTSAAAAWCGYRQ